MTKYGFVASGGGYRSFYTAGALVWLKQHDIPVVHIASTSSGNNITIDYLLWDAEAEELPPVLTRTMRLSVTDIFQVFSNFLGLRPSLLPSGSHLFTVDKDNCRKSLQLDDPRRRAILAKTLQTVRWDILATNLTKRESRYFNVNQILEIIRRPQPRHLHGRLPRGHYDDPLLQGDNDRRRLLCRRRLPR